MATTVENLTRRSRVRPDHADHQRPGGRLRARRHHPRGGASASASTSPRCATSRACRPTPPAASAWSRSRARRKMVPSCATAAADGMVVHTDTEQGARHAPPLPGAAALSDHNSFCTPPCRDACPTHIKIPQFLDFIAHGDYKNGVRKLREDLPFPAMLGRVCPRPCEGPCRRQLVEHPITICWLHRFMADQCLDEEQEGELLLPVEPKPDSGKRIAVVGGGPAGLAAAFYARLEGHAVKIFEALPKPGGMLRYGIPSYRLPRDLLDKELNVLWRLGVELQCNKRLGVDFQLEDLLERGYDAVFLALGAFNSNEMGVAAKTPTASSRRSTSSSELELTGDVHVGQKVTVIGGGFTAMDACRTAIRKGAKEVTLPLPPLAQGDARPPHRGRRGRGGGRQARAAGARRCRVVTDDAQQGRRHRDAAHGAGRARRLRPAPAGAHRGLRVRRRLRPGDHRHRPVPEPRRHQRRAGRQAHQVEDHRRRRLHLPDRGPARVRRRRRGARRADRDPGGRPGQEGGLEHRRLLARRGHGGAVAAAWPSSRPRRSSTRSRPRPTSTRASRAWPRSRRCSST